MKSNALDGLALGEDRSVPTGWASFAGRAKYLEPGWEEPERNHGVTVYVEDRGQPGAGADRFWLQVRDRDGQVVDAFSVAPAAGMQARTLAADNAFAPHGRKSRPIR